MITIYSIVQFKPDYTGYFRDYKNKPLTIMQVFNGNKNDPTERVTILEINEMHLIGMHHLEEYKNESN